MKLSPESVGQFTGLQDKNGKDVCEGDVVSFRRFMGGRETYKGVVVFEDGAFLVEPAITIIPDYLYGHLDTIEIIGNIHENPELIPSTQNIKQ
jgi:uncharacterized phage protein (TIGR01671 family)